MAKGKDKEQLILISAMKIFSKSGFSKSSIQEIAAEAEIGKGTIYEYFKSKDELFIAAYENEAMLFHDQMAQAVRNASTFEEKLQKLLSFIQTVAHERRQLKVHMHNNIGDLKDESKKAMQQLYGRLRKWHAGVMSEVLLIGISEGKVRELDVDAVSVTLMDFIIISQLMDLPTALDENFKAGSVCKTKNTLECDNSPLVFELLMNGIGSK